HQIGLGPGKLNATAAGLAEFLGGILLTLGLLTPFAAVVLIATMVAAIAAVHFKNGVWNTNKGYEFNLVLILAFLVLAATDAGRYSLDHWLGLSMDGTAWGLGALGAGVVGGLGAVTAARLLGRDRRGGEHPHPSAA